MRFERFLKSIDRGFLEKLSKARIPEEIRKNLRNTLKNDITSIRGKEFYYILNSISNDFEADTDLAFREYLRKKRKKRADISKPKTTTNRHQDFIKQFLVLKQNIAIDADIEYTRLSKVLSGTVKDFLAYEVYAIAKSRGVGVKRAFEQLYK